MKAAKNASNNQVADAPKDRLSAKGRTGRNVSVLLNHPLPDGTTLLDPANAEFRATLEAIYQIELERRKDGTGAFSEEGAIDIARELQRPIHWMKIRGIASFSDLTFREVRRYLADYSKGLDYSLQATPRFSAYLIELQTSDSRAIREIPLPQHLERCGIPSMFISRLPNCRSLYQKVLTGIELESADIAPQPHSMVVESIYGHVAAIEKLWLYRHKLPDSLKFNPVPETPHVYAQKRGVAGGHTRTIPPELGALLYSKAIHWVLDIGPELMKVTRANEKRMLEIRDATKLGLLEDLPECKAFNALAAKNWGWEIPLIGLARNGRVGVELRSATNTYLLSACFIAMDGFTGRRGIELESLKCNCISGNRETGYWIESYIGKRDTIERTPCPEIVVHAVRMILALYGKSDGDSNEPLFKLRDKSGKLSGATPENLNGFARFVGADSSSEMTEAWVYAKHQFRRLFAIIYVWRYEFPCLVSLQYHLRHLYLWMTRIYFNDKRMEEDILSESRKLTATKLREIASGEVTARGILGKSLARQMERQGFIEIVDQAKLEKKLEDYVVRRGLTLKATWWGWCGASRHSSNLRRAACHKQPNSPKAMEPFVGGPAGHGSSEDVCAGCFFHMTDDTREAHWLQLSEKLRTAANASRFSMLGEAISKRLAKVESFVRNNFRKA